MVVRDMIPIRRRLIERFDLRLMGLTLIQDIDSGTEHNSQRKCSEQEKREKIFRFPPSYPRRFLISC